MKNVDYPALAVEPQGWSETSHWLPGMPRHRVNMPRAKNSNSDGPSTKTFFQERMEAQKRMDLEKYHFITTMGSLLRNLKRSERLFPSIQSAYRNAQHLLTEGKQLRDMVEHAEEYLAGQGRNQSAFLREAEGVATNLPGSSPGIADATSTIIDENGHWIGGRLNVERVIAEVRLIAEEAAKIPAPEPHHFRQPGGR
jgi:hypothetical protein